MGVGADHRTSGKFPISKSEIMIYNWFMQGQDIALLLKLAIQNEPQVLSKALAESLFISPSEVSKSLKRSADSGLLYMSDGEKRVNRSALMEFLSHGLKYAFPPARGSLVRGVPTAAAAEPLKSRFLEDGDPPAVWPYVDESPSRLYTRPRPRPRYEIPSSTVFSRSAMQFVVEERANETSQSNFSEKR